MYYRLTRISTIKANDTQSWTLTLPATIGRGEEATVSINDESISRTHCQLRLGPDESLVVKDLGSTNGTFVNGDRIKQTHSLVPGDALQVGAIVLLVEYASDTDPGSPIKKKAPVSTATTQSMRTIPQPIAVKQEISKPAKQWWEFWK